mmetsp:Transcript_41652/g.42456  ORF Transcript_41652/g.42456 Transcript_41652/m.42456 type:complete len:800 (+) Transcript_41652:114-2513(+)
MIQNAKCGGSVETVKENAYVSVPTVLPHHHHQPTVTSTSGINTSHLAAMAAGSHTYAPVDHSAAFMMSNAAATIAAVAASAVQQMTQAKVPPGTAVATAAGGTSSAMPPALYHAALQGNRNTLLPVGSSSSQHATVPPHAALLTALANAGAGQPSSIQSITSPPSVPGHVGASVSSLLRPNAPVLSQSTSTLASPALLSDMQSWTLERLDQHIVLLHQMNQPVPHSVSILRSEAERKIKKKNDKRVANRKSASNSRARKKALVEEMTKTNARLKKQAMILALLPDLVITTTIEGEITFCSAQADRILQYQSDDLLGKKLYDLLVPSSRNALKSLIEELVHPGKAKMARASVVARVHRGTKLTIMNQRNDSNKNTEDINGNSNASARDSSRSGGNSTDDTSGAVAIVSEQSFPLSVVEVESKQQSHQLNQGMGAESSENLDSSTSNGGGSSEDDGAATSEGKRKESNKTPARNDDYSPLSSETKNLRANNNLDRNVRWHNQRMLEGNNKSETDYGPKDDVTGASVTANNASARLSSLEHCPNTFRTKENDEPLPYESIGDQSSLDDSLLAGVEEKKKNEDASDDSGYRESNASREESSSCWSDTSQSNDHRKKPLAPTCRMWLIRDDLTTVWCEVTSSIRNKSSDEDTGEEKPTNLKSTESSDVSGTNIDQELLLCLRPIRNGAKKVDESLRFVPLNEHQLPTTSPRESTEAWVSGNSSSANTNKETEGHSVRTVARTNSNNNLSASSKQELNKKRPPKKRPLVTNVHSHSDVQTPKRPKHDSSETDVVESLMLMNKSSQ